MDDKQLRPLAGLTSKPGWMIFCIVASAIMWCVAICLGFWAIKATT